MISRETQAKKRFRGGRKETIMFKVNILGLEESFKRALSEVLEEDGCLVAADGYKITAELGDKLKVAAGEKGCKITYSQKCEFFRGFSYLKNQIPAETFTVEETRKYDLLGLMADNSRNAVFNMNTAKAVIRTIAKAGFNALELYTEDTYEVNDEPYFGYKRGRFTKAELKELNAYAADFGVELIPCVQTLAHVNQIVRWQEYGEIIDCNDILLVGEERTYELIEHIFQTLAECFTSRRVNIGMDEAHMLGLGKYLDKHGYRDRFDIMREHLERVLQICKKYGFKPSMWSDMFFRLMNGGDYYKEGDSGKLAEKAKIPDGVQLIYWDYYAQNRSKYDSMLSAHKKLVDNVQFAGGAWKWIGFAPDNRLSLNNSKLALDACDKAGVKDVLVTAWGDNGAEASIFSVLPTLVYFGERAYGHKDKASFSRAFERVADLPLKDFLSIDFANRLTKNTAPAETNNSSKVYLYNDPLLGIYDTLIDENSLAVYKENLPKIRRAAKKSVKYGYIFDTQYALLNALTVKFDLGLKTRAAYKTGDRAAMKELIPVYKTAIKRITEFYEIFKRQWSIENKPSGFEIQDMRLGGLILRVKHCLEIIQAYASGETDFIPELEEKLIDVFGREKIEPCYTFYENVHLRVVSACAP